jgi:hypothetical protein
MSTTNPKYTFDQYRKIFAGAVAKYEGEPFFGKIAHDLGRPAFPAARREVAIIGIRHAGKVVDFRDDIADDMISLVRFDSDSLPMVREYVGTTEPGRFSEEINKQGDFEMCPGFYYFGFGLHHGKNPCLVQACAVRGERAHKHEDFNWTDTTTWTITDGSLHIHAGIRDVNHVGNWSAGCQVIAHGWEGAEWKEFYKYCDLATKKPIPYVLVNETDIQQFLA